MAGLSSNNFNCCETAACNKPAPNVVNKQARACYSVENNEEAHHLLVFFVDEMVPDCHGCEQEVTRPQPCIENEEQKEALVLEANTIIREWTMMAHLEHASLANRAMMRTSWLQFVAISALTIPVAFEICHCFGSIFHKTLNILL